MTPTRVQPSRSIEALRVFARDRVQHEQRLALGMRLLLGPLHQLLPDPAPPRRAVDEHPRDVCAVRLVRMRCEDDLDRSDDRAVDERGEEQPAPTFDLRRIRLVHATRLLVRERRQVADGSAAFDAVGEDRRQPVEMRPGLARVESADLDPFGLRHRAGYGSSHSRYRVSTASGQPA